MPIYSTIKKPFKKLKESLKDPFSSLRIISFIFFLFLSLGISFQTLPTRKTPSFLGYFSKISSQVLPKDPFLNPTNRFFLESPDFLLVEKSNLRAATPPYLLSPQVLGTLIGEDEPVEVKKEIREYLVEEGETLSSLAERFEISLNTILWANKLTEKSIIRQGQKLVIPPVSGVIHHIKSGDTLSEIARTYQGKIDEIVAFNNLANENDIYIGDILVIPNGIMPQPSKSQLAPLSLPLVDSQFIPPLSSPYSITQGLHWYNAVDLSHPDYACGKPVFAVAGGIVQKTGYDRIAGNYIRILHPNNLVTFYGHLSVIRVKSGTEVNVGEIIGYIGNTGYARGTTGCHLHFEVRGARNPFAK